MPVRDRARLIVLVTVGALGLIACGPAQPDAFPQPPPALQSSLAQNGAVNLPSTDPTVDPSGPSLDLLITKSMLYDAAMRFHVNPYLVMGLAWHESGWQPDVISSAGAVGIMQVMPATAERDGPILLNRVVNLHDPAENIDMGTAILRHNLDAYGGDIAKALTAYYAGGSAVTDWDHLRADCRRYVWAVYNAAMMFLQGRGPV